MAGSHEETHEPVPEGILPLSEGKSCGTGCSSGASHGASAGHGRRQEPRVQIPFADRDLNLGAVPAVGSLITAIDLDVTVECNLRCTYCFKEKWTEHMEEQVAYDAMVWFIHASGDSDKLSVALMGGEPLLRFKLIKKMVPFAKRRAAQHGKEIHFSMTTNGTLVTDEVIQFWHEWNMGFHTSIDGTPDIQDRNRPTTGGKGSARLVEKAVPRILSYQRNTTARSTVVPSNAGALVASYKYFRSLGYVDIAFVPGGQNLWTDDDIRIYEEQFREVAELMMDDLRAGNAVNLKGMDDYAKGRARGHRHPHPCGAGRGMVLVDIHGDLWPCHRWNKQTQADWRIGSIYQQFSDAIRSPLDVPSFADMLENDCPNCPANKMCSGGCPAENLEQTGSVYHKHPRACQLTRVWARVGQHVYETMMAEGNELYQQVYLSDPDSPDKD
jgi:uncharacterized protein